MALCPHDTTHSCMRTGARDSAVHTSWLTGTSGTCNAYIHLLLVAHADVAAGRCPPGTGGPSCVMCPKGAWSAGGNSTHPTPYCVWCIGKPSGIATPGPGAKSPDECTGDCVRPRLPSVCNLSNNAPCPPPCKYARPRSFGQKSVCARSW